jgi:hypothetical protein
MENKDNQLGPVQPDPTPQINQLPNLVPNLQEPTPVTIVQPPAPPAKKFSKKLLILLAVILLAGIGAAAYSLRPKNQPTTASSTQPVKKFSLDQIKNQDDIEKLGKEDQRAFCTEYLKYKPDSPEITKFNKRLSLSSEDSDDLYLGCVVRVGGEDYVAKDKSGANDALYRRDAQKYKDIAKTFTFDTYDTNYKINDLGMSERATNNIKGEAKSLIISYSTLSNGGFDPYSSKAVIRIQEFDKSEFPDLTSNCGPTLMTIEYAHFDNNSPCQKTTASFVGQPIYKGKGISSDSYNVTINNTRITLEGRNEQESLVVLQSMKKVPISDLDFFIKN